MRNKSTYLPFIIIACFSLIFMAAILITQNQSASIINQLRSGNSQAVRTIKVYNRIDDIINEIFIVQNLSAKYIESGDTSIFKDLRDTLEQLNNDNTDITRLADGNDSNRILISRFNSLVTRIKEPIERLQSPSGDDEKNTIAASLTSENTKITSDSIYTTALAIQQKFEKDLQSTIIRNELLSAKALSLSVILGLISIAAIAILGTIIILRLLRHYQLIKKLHKVNEDLLLAKQQAEKAANIKEEFLSNMSHEIRTPVNSIIGFTNLLQRTTMQKEQEQFVRLIKSASEILLDIVNDILDISKIEAGMLQFDKKPFELKELCYSIEMLFYHLITDKNLSYETIIDENVPERLIGDKERLSQILTNIIGNAIKFTDSGSVAFNLSVVEKKESSIRLRFVIKDTGIGIDPQKLESIFERFEQEQNITSRNYGGTGLGLSIVKNLVTMQGGTVTAKSKPGGGAEFIVEMPFLLSDNPLLNTDTSGTSRISIPFNKSKKITNRLILAVEDNPMNQMLLSYIFQRWDAEYHFADSGENAIKLLSQNKYELVLMDIQMPVMDGYTLTKKIRDDLKIQIPIIAMSAKVLPGEKEKCIKMGMNDYIPKPLNEYDLYEMIIRNLRQAPTKSPVNISSHYKYIDTPHLIKIYHNNVEFIKKLLQQFMEQYPSELYKLREMVAVENYEETNKISHLMKTTVSLLNRQSPLLKHLETMESSDNSISGWEIIRDETNFLWDVKEEVLNEIVSYKKQLN
jgi:signal transduction histidine kinase/CheY-like chemotaxis protein